MAPIIVYISIHSYESSYVWIVFLITWLLFLLIFQPKILCYSIFGIMFYLFIYWLKRPLLLDENEYLVSGKVVKITFKYTIISVNNNRMVIDNINLRGYNYDELCSLTLRGRITDSLSSIALKPSYVYQNNIHNYIINPKIIRIDKPYFSLNKAIEKWYLSKNDLFQQYFPTIVLGKYGYGDQHIENIKKLGIVHLFAISGFHFDIIFKASDKIMQKVKIKEKIGVPIVILVSFLYITLLTNWVSPLRAWIMFIYKKYSKEGQKNKSMNGMLLALFITFLINPIVLLTYGLLLSYYATFCVLVFAKVKYFKHKKLSIFNKLITIMIIQAIMTPFTANLGSFIAPLAFIYVFLLSPLIEFTFIVSIIFFWWRDGLNYLYFSLDKIMYWSQYINFNIILTFKFNWNLLTIHLLTCTYFIVIGKFIIGWRNEIKKSQKA